MGAERTISGRYRLAGLIGAGGMGEVHRAYDFAAGRYVAVKLLPGGAGSVDVERLEREADALMRVAHPNIVRLVDHGVDDGSPWLAMELVRGPDLRALLRREGAQDGATVRRVLAGVAAALACLHAGGLVHRDVKPANVLLTAEPDEGEWDVRLADLGIARLAGSDGLSGSGAMIGTVRYLSPEQVSGGPVAATADVFALGLLAVEALTGSAPYPGTAVESAAARLVRAPVLPPGLEPSWRSLLEAMTDLDASRRPTASSLQPRIAALPAEAIAGPGSETADAVVAITAPYRPDVTEPFRPVRAAIPPSHAKRRAVPPAAVLTGALVLTLGAAGVAFAATPRSAAHDAAATTSATHSSSAPSASATPSASTAAGGTQQTVDDGQSATGDAPAGSGPADSAAGPGGQAAGPGDQAAGPAGGGPAAPANP